MSEALRRAAMRRTLRSALRWVACLWACLLLSGVPAKEAVPLAEDPAVDRRLVAISSELRCLVCQNQTIADSPASLAVDLRNQLREMIKRGDSDKQIIDYMTARYGNFVLYRPPLIGTTALLWFGPALLLVVGVTVLGVTLWRRQRMRPDQFEPDDPTEMPAAR